MHAWINERAYVNAVQFMKRDIHATRANIRNNNLSPSRGIHDNGISVVGC
jgi:hypothetical protein